MKKVVPYILMLSFVIVFIYLVIPDGSSFTSSDYNMESSGNISTDKSVFRVYIENWIQSKDEVTETVSTQGQQLADAAYEEYEYFISNSLSGGYRYWYWYDHIPDLVADGSSIDDSQWFPYSNHIKKNGWYSKGLTSGNKSGAQWCNMFVSCIAQKAGLSTGVEYGNGDNGAPITMGCKCTHTYAWFTTSGANCYILTSSYAYKTDQCSSLYNTLGSYGGDVSVIKEVNSFEPEPGDIVFYLWEGRSVNDMNHIGIVYEVTEDGNITVIAGNEDKTTGVIDSKVTLKTYAPTKVDFVGYVRPDYN